MLVYQRVNGMHIQYAKVCQKVRSRVASCCPHFSSRIAKANKEIDTTRAQTMQTM